MKLLLISDIHGNLEALESVLSVPHDRVICLGDLVDYGPDPAACIDLLRNSDIPVIRGNHDNAVATGMDCGCGYTYKHLSIATREYTLDVLGEDYLDYLRSLPMHLEELIDGKKYYFTHASPRSMYDYIKPDTPDEEVLEMFPNSVMDGVDVLVAGHSHIPLVRDIGDITIINPGSVGQPRDAVAGASCALMDTVDLSVEFIRLNYDLEIVIGKIEEKMWNSKELVDILMRGF